MLQNFREYFFFLSSLRLLLACFVKFFKAELCDKYLVGAVSYTYIFDNPIEIIVSTNLICYVDL